MSGTSLCHELGFCAVTIADLRSSLAGAGTFPLGVLGLVSPVLSERADSSDSAAVSPTPTGRRLPFAVTTAGPVISASFRPFRFGGRL